MLKNLTFSVELCKLRYVFETNAGVGVGGSI
jgi:hypothetical protein